MSRESRNESSGVGPDNERILALSTFLRSGALEFDTWVRGGSMGTALPEGSKIRIRFAKENQLTVGQIVVYVSKYGVVAHRLVRCANSNGVQYLITRGDATVCCDVPTQSSAVFGIVTEFLSGGSWQPVPPPAPRWFGFRVVASAISGFVWTALRVNPQISCLIAKQVARIRRSIIRAIRLGRRLALRHSSAGVES
jgi:hypothetical protein